MHSKSVSLVAASVILVLLASACKAAPTAAGPLAVSRIAAGGNQTCVLEKGKAKCWGENDGGQLGDGTSENRNTPVDVTVLPDELVFISVGYNHTCVLTKDGDVMCWGGGWTGRLAGAEAGGAYRAVSAGGFHTCVVTAAGGAQCWGGNALAGMGNEAEGGEAEPADVTGLTQDVQGISAGTEFSCAIQKGAAKCWGVNDSGQLGDGTFTSSVDPRGVVGLESGVKAVVAGVLHACALTAAGEVWCWGDNLSGELGDGSYQSSPVPVKVGGLEGIQAIAVGGSHTCVLTKSGGVKCWGDNSGGQLGDGTTANRNVPADVGGLESGVVAIAAGGSHTCAMLSGGAVKCWGQGEEGQLGNGANTGSSTPVDVILQAS